MRSPVSYPSLPTFLFALAIALLLTYLLFAPSWRDRAQQTQSCLESGGVPAELRDGKYLCFDPDALVKPSRNHPVDCHPARTR